MTSGKLRALPRPRGILFDYGETLVTESRLDRAAGTARLLSLATDDRGKTVEEVEALAVRLWADHERRRHASLLEVSVTNFQRLLYGTLGISFDISSEQMAREYWNAAVETKPMPGAREVLAELAGDGVPIAVVSNTAFGTEIVRDELARHGLDRHLHFVLGSSDYGLRKPHPAIFELAATKLHIAVDQIWFVGDSLECDVVGAKGVGMTAIWLNLNGASAESTNEPDAVVGSLAELAQLYRRRT